MLPEKAAEWGYPTRRARAKDAVAQEDDKDGRQGCQGRRPLRRPRLENETSERNEDGGGQSGPGQRSQKSTPTLSLRVEGFSPPLGNI